MGQDGSARPGADGCRFVGALGDIHGAFDAAREIVARHPEVPFWLCVGDIADEHGRYESLGARVYWIHGNNDNFDAMASGDLPPDLHHIPNGTAIDIAGSEDPAYDTGDPAYDTGDPAYDTRDPAYDTGDPAYDTGDPAYDTGDPAHDTGDPAHDTGDPAHDTGDPAHDTPRADVGRVFRPGVRIAGLGGTFAPTWYEARAADLPHPKKGSAKATELADKRRHFVREQVDACKQLRDVDIFLSHEAPKPFRPFPGGRGPDAGKAQINEILAAMKPRLHLFGHHHRFSDEMREGVRSVGLDLVTRAYLLIDPVSLDIRLRTL